MCNLVVAHAIVQVPLCQRTMSFNALRISNPHRPQYHTITALPGNFKYIVVKREDPENQFPFSNKTVI
jgi:hypothetical protein